MTVITVKPTPTLRAFKKGELICPNNSLDYIYLLIEELGKPHKFHYARLYPSPYISTVDGGHFHPDQYRLFAGTITLSNGNSDG